MKKKFLIWISIIPLFVITDCSNDEVKELIDYYNNDWLTSQIMKEENVKQKTKELIEIESEGDEKASIFVKEELLPKHGRSTRLSTWY